MIWSFNNPLWANSGDLSVACAPEVVNLNHCWVGWKFKSVEYTRHLKVKTEFAFVSDWHNGKLSLCRMMLPPKKPNNSIKNFFKFNNFPWSHKDSFNMCAWVGHLNATFCPGKGGRRLLKLWVGSETINKER